MHRLRTLFLLASLLLLLPLGALAQDGSHVQLPLEAYQQLAGGGSALPGYALGAAEVALEVEDSGGRRLAMVDLTLPVQVVRDGEVAVHVLPPGTAVLSAENGAGPIALTATSAVERTAVIVRPPPPCGEDESKMVDGRASEK